MPVASAVLVERLSYLSSTAKIKDAEGGYIGVTTPGPDDLEGGALRPGGQADVYSREYIGLLAQYATVGIVYGTLPNTVYPVLQQYFNMEGTQIVSANVLLSLPWSFKAFYGILSDCVPIFGYRRRPFMIIGWTLCALMTLIMACSKMGSPYYLDRSLASRKPSTYTPDEWATGIDLTAPDRGGKFIVLMMLAAVGYLGADVAADAVTVELAQREPEAVRGTVQTTIYLVRSVFVTLANIITGFFFNGRQYGGDFDFSLTFPQVMAILTVLTLPVIPITWFFIKEEKHPGVDFKVYIRELWELLQSRAVYQVIAYKFCSGIFEKISVTTSSPMASYWAKVTPINDTIASVIGNIVYSFVLYFTIKYGLGWNWRWMHGITVVASAAVDAVPVFLTTWNVFRSQWFWLGPPILENLPDGVGGTIGGFVYMELAGIGNEGACYGLLSTVSNLTGTFASTITKNIDANFKVQTTYIQEDTFEVRRDVTYIYLIAYMSKAVGLCFLPLLPAQKKETQELKAKGGKSKLCGAVALFCLVFALSWSVMVNIMSIYPSTKCLKLVGGTGCK